MIDQTSNPLVSLLVIDDDRICREAVKRALRKENLENPIYEAANGVEALRCLRGEDGHRPIPRPFTILLDLNMPQMTGHEFLTCLRQDPELCDANVFVVTTSLNEVDMKQSYLNNAAGYVTKSLGPNPFSDLARMLREYWSVVRLA
jgi:CheY-like chemotaxis protein